MAIISCSGIQQDTVQGINIVLKDSIGIKSDSVSIINAIQSDDSVFHNVTSASKSNTYSSDSTPTNDRNNNGTYSTFYDTNNFTGKIEPAATNNFPTIFAGKIRQMQIEESASLHKHLKPGQDLPVQTLHEDWIIVIILFSALLFSLVRNRSNRMLSGVTGFFMFRSTNDLSSRDFDGIFRWQSTIINLISFLNIGLFAYFAAYYYDFIPSGISGITFWLISLGIIIPAVTLRHIVCLIAGNISAEKEAFSEYMFCIYQYYRNSALFLFVFVILISYTSFFPEAVSIISGVIVLGIMYLIRIIKLIIIFLNHNISIFYLILYLCALEILPVLISVKYFSGLF